MKNVIVKNDKGYSTNKCFWLNKISNPGLELHISLKVYGFYLYMNIVGIMKNSNPKFNFYLNKHMYFLNGAYCILQSHSSYVKCIYHETIPLSQAKQHCQIRFFNSQSKHQDGGTFLLYFTSTEGNRWS